MATPAGAGCSGGDTGPETTPPQQPPPAFPKDYAKTYTQVRECRTSADHDLNRVRVLADPGATEPYMNRDNPFPTGSVVLKEEHDPADDTCSGPIVFWTVMQRTPSGGNPNLLGWHWQKVDANRNTIENDSQRCPSCHVNCTPPDGYESTCEVP